MAAKKSDIRATAFAGLYAMAVTWATRLNRWRGVAAPAGHISALILLVMLVWKIGPIHLGSLLAPAGCQLVVSCATISLAGFFVLVTKWRVATLHSFNVRPPLVRLLGLHPSSILWGSCCPYLWGTSSVGADAWLR